MFLNSNNLTHYLLSRGLVSLEEVVRGPFMIQEASSRNRNFKVHRGNEPGLFVKQVPIVAGETTSSIFREAACYQLAEQNENFGALRGYITKIYDYDPNQHVLVLEMLPPCESYTKAHLRLNSFPSELASLVGQALGEVHASADKMLANPRDLVAFPRMKPWVLNIAHNAEAVLHNMNQQTRQLVAAIRKNPVLVSGLDYVFNNWRNDVLIHGDVKWENFLLEKDTGKDHKLLLIDWELADVGDALWDVGCVFSSYLQFWLASMSADGSTADTTELISNAPHKLEALWPALGSFWNTYCATRGFSSDHFESELYLATVFTAARVVLIAFEIAVQLQQPSRTIELCLQLATAMFSNPKRGLSEILGFSNISNGKPSKFHQNSEAEKAVSMPNANLSRNEG